MFYTGKLPSHFVSSPKTVRQMGAISRQCGIPADEVVKTFNGGPYKGTWVHSLLAVIAAEYLDNSGELGVIMSRAFLALAAPQVC